MSEDRQAGAPTDDRRPLGGLGVRQVRNVLLREAGDKSAEVSVLEDVSLGVLAVERAQCRVRGLDRRNIDGEGRELALEGGYASGRLRSGDMTLPERLQDRVGAVKEAVYGNPDRLDPGDILPELSADRCGARCPRRVDAPTSREYGGAQGPCRERGVAQATQRPRYTCDAINIRSRRRRTSCSRVLPRCWLWERSCPRRW